LHGNDLRVTSELTAVQELDNSHQDGQNPFQKLTSGKARFEIGMDKPESRSLSKSQSRDMLAIAGRSRARRSRYQFETELQISDDIWSDEALCGLLELWLVPTTVDRIIVDLLNSKGDEVT
jgi:hypothetical protein